MSPGDFSRRRSVMQINPGRHRTFRSNAGPVIGLLLLEILQDPEDAVWPHPRLAPF
jgi:hypothetical protein